MGEGRNGGEDLNQEHAQLFKVCRFPLAFMAQGCHNGDALVGKVK